MTVQVHTLGEADTARWDAVVALATDEWGRLDILINNAGIVSQLSIEDVDDAAWDRIYGVNIKGTMAGCRAAIAAMKANPGGSSGSIGSASLSGQELCPDCLGSRHSGRRVVAELIAFNDLQKLSELDADAWSKIDWPQHLLSGTTIRDDAFRLRDLGVVDSGEIYRVLGDSRDSLSES